MTDELTEQVAQEDRDAAAECLSANYVNVDGWSIRRGLCDHDYTTQAFARHRIAAIAAARPALLEEGARLGAKATFALFTDQDNLAPEYDFSRLNYAEIVKEASA